MSSKEYWEKRKAQRMWEYMDEAEKTADQISKAYEKADNYLEKEIDKIYTRYKSKHGLSDLEARQFLHRMHDKTSFEEFRSMLKQADEAEKKELLALIEAPAYASRIAKLQEMQERIDDMMKSIYHQELSHSNRHYADLANEAYYKTIYDIQKDVGIAFSFSETSTRQIDKLLKSKWSGINYSKRIWNNTHNLAETLKQELLVGLMTGRSDREVCEFIRHRFASGAMEARRLVRTESCFIANEMEGQAYEESGIDRYMYVATLDKKTSKMCQELDHKVFAVKDRKPNVNYPPMHPWCRSTTIAYLNDEVLEDMTKKARDPESGRIYSIPANISYEDWKEKYVDSIKRPFKDDDVDIPFQKRDGTLQHRKTKHAFSDGTYNEKNWHVMEAYEAETLKGTKIYWPVSLDKTKQPIDVSNLYTVLNKMPDEVTKYIDAVEIVDYQNPQDAIISKIYNKENFVSAAVGGNRKITFFPAKNNQTIAQQRAILYHESAHILEDEFFSLKGVYPSNSEDYIQAMRADECLTSKRYVSRYAERTKSKREDLADALKYYGTDKEKMLSEYPNRTKFIEGWLKWFKRK